MVNFTNHVAELAYDVIHMLQLIGFRPTMSKTATKKGGYKYCVRVARNTEELISAINLTKT